MWPNVGQTGVSGRPPRPHQAGGGAFFIIEETRQYESGDNGGAVSPPLTPHMLPRICRATPGTNSYCSPDREYHQAGYVQCTSTELYVIYNTLWNFISKQLLQARSKVSLYLYPFELLENHGRKVDLILYRNWSLPTGYTGSTPRWNVARLVTLLPTVQPRGAVFQMWHFLGL